MESHTSGVNPVETYRDNAQRGIRVLLLRAADLEPETSEYGDKKAQISAAREANRIIGWANAMLKAKLLEPEDHPLVRQIEEFAKQQPNAISNESLQIMVLQAIFAAENNPDIVDQINLKIKSRRNDWNEIGNSKLAHEGASNEEDPSTEPPAAGRVIPGLEQPPVKQQPSPVDPTETPAAQNEIKTKTSNVNYAMRSELEYRIHNDIRAYYSIVASESITRQLIQGNNPSEIEFYGEGGKAGTVTVKEDGNLDLRSEPGKQLHAVFVRIPENGGSIDIEAVDKDSGITNPREGIFLVSTEEIDRELVHNAIQSGQVIDRAFLKDWTENPHKAVNSFRSSILRECLMTAPNSPYNRWGTEITFGAIATREVRAENTLSPVLKNPENASKVADQVVQEVDALNGSEEYVKQFLTDIVQPIVSADNSTNASKTYHMYQHLKKVANGDRSAYIEYSVLPKVFNFIDDNKNENQVLMEQVLLGVILRDLMKSDEALEYTRIPVVTYLTVYRIDIIKDFLVRINNPSNNCRLSSQELSSNELTQEVMEKWQGAIDALIEDEPNVDTIKQFLAYTYDNPQLRRLDGVIITAWLARAAERGGTLEEKLQNMAEVKKQIHELYAGLKQGAGEGSIQISYQPTEKTEI
jgi:hypothetical protein